MNAAEQRQDAFSGPLLFPRTARLLKHAAFDRVYRAGRRIFSANMTVFFRFRDSDEPEAGPRVGLTVGRALGNAVERNRIKRRLREAVRQRLTLLDLPVDVVINPKKTALKAEFGQLLAETERAFGQVRLGMGAGANGRMKSPNTRAKGGQPQRPSE